MAHIAFNKVTIDFNSHLVMEDFSFSIEKGEIVTLFGPSGCGKSSLMKALLNMIKVAKGNVVINGENAVVYKKVLSYVPQENQLLPWLTVEENIELWKKDSGNQDANATEKVLEVVGLHSYKKRYIQELSGGMQRRVALARGLATQSDILCLDEVLVSIERGLRRHLMEQIRNYIKENNISTFIISHDFEEAVFMSDKIYVLSHSPTEILKTIIIENTSRSISYFESTEFDVKSKLLLTK